MVTNLEQSKISQKQYESLVQTIDGIVWEADADTFTFTFVSNQAERILGYPVHRWLEGNTFWADHIHPDDKDWAVKFCIDATQRREDHQFEYRMIAANGEIVWLRDNVTIAIADDGRVLLRGIMVDITGRTRAEDENKKLLHDLTERVKELSAVHATARILHIGWSDMDTVLFEIASLFPPAFQYPDVTAARVRLGSVSAQTKGFAEGRPVLAAEFLTADNLPGSIEVVYTEDKPPESEGPFLVEERALIDTIAEMLRVAYDRQHSETALRVSEERYRDLVENAHDIIYSHDLEGNYLSVNKAGERIMGYSRAEALKMNLTQTIPPEYHEMAKQMLAEKLNGAAETVYDIELLTKDKRRIAVEINSWLVVQNGRPVAVQGIARDVTGRKLAEENVLKEKQLNDAILDSLPGVFYLFNRKGERLRWNANLEKVTGFSAEELAKKPLFSTIVDEDRDTLRKTFEEVFTIGHASGEGYVGTKDGMRVPYFTTGRRVDIDGEPHLLGIGIDISERKRAEEELRESQRRFSDTLTNLDMIAVMTDVEGTITFCNDYMLRLTGWERDDAIGKSWFEMFIPESERERVRPILDEIPADGSVRPHFENEIKTRSGELRLVRWANTTLRDVDGQIVGVAALGDDITDFKTAQDALRKSEEQLRQSQKMEAVGQLAGGIAHDFNNLLTAIIGYSQLAARRLRNDDPIRHNIDEIERAGERAASLTRQLLAFSRKQLLQPKILDLNFIVSDMQRMLGRVLGEDVELETRLDPSIESVKADPGQIEQVIMNLAVNARDAMPNGGRLTIETKNVYLDDENAGDLLTVDSGNYVMMAVTDTGSGMDETIQSHIFEPFFSTKDVGKGTGLGLSTVYGIVKQSEGYIWVTSGPGKGAKFEIYLPCVEKTAEDYTPNAEPEDGYAGSETILLVEDEEIVRTLVVEVLKTRGYNVIEAASGREALTICSNYEGSIDLLLTDVIMPEMSGRELQAQMAELCPDIKVLFMSGYTDDTIVRHRIHESDMPFLQKPFAPQLLAQKVREVLDN